MLFRSVRRIADVPAPAPETSPVCSTIATGASPRIEFRDILRRAFKASALALLLTGSAHALRAQQVTPPKTMRVIAELLVVGICTLAFALNASGLVVTLLTDNYAGDRDFVSYWSAGHQIAEHGNPYDGKAILGLERAAGFSTGHPPLIMRNPQIGRASCRERV